MKFKVYRITEEADKRTHALFLYSGYLQKKGLWPPKIQDYACIYQGEDPALEGMKAEKALEKCLRIFDKERPAGTHKGSVGDVVMLMQEPSNAYFCDSFGWELLGNFRETK